HGLLLQLTSTAPSVISRPTAGTRAAARRLEPRYASEAHSHQSLECIRVAFEVRSRHPMAPEKLATEVDKRDGAPKQVGGSVRQLLVAGCALLSDDARIYRV